MTRAVTDFSADDAGAGSSARAGRGALGRLGLLARGVLYVVLGILALQFAFGVTGNEQVSNQGAIRFVRQAPLGPVLLWALAAGLVALALWHVALVFTGDPVRGDGAARRALYGVKGVLYGAVATSAVAAALGGGSGSSGGGGSSDRTQAAAYVLDLPFGRWLVGGIGIGVLVYALWSVAKHVVGTEFMQWLTTARMDRRTTAAVRTSGRVGYGGRAVVIGMTGVFLVVAALQHSAERSRGLAGSLLALSHQPYGRWLLTGVAVGLALFGLFSMVEARYRRAA